MKSPREKKPLCVVRGSALPKVDPPERAILLWESQWPKEKRWPPTPRVPREEVPRG